MNITLMYSIFGSAWHMPSIVTIKIRYTKKHFIYKILYDNEQDLLCHLNGTFSNSCVQLLLLFSFICCCNHKTATKRKKITKPKIKKKKHPTKPHNHNQNNNKTFMGYVHLNFTHHITDAYIFIEM